VTNGSEAKSLSLAPQESCSNIAHVLDAEVALPPTQSRFTLRNGGDFACRPTRLSGLETTIALIALQFALFAMIAAYLAFSAATLHRRNRVSWESLSSRLDPARLAPAMAVSESARVAVLASDRSARWSAFRDAGVLMQMADFADRNSSAIDPSALASLRADAIRMRFAVLYSFVQHPQIL
jgi:hypothetical protein